MTKKSSPIRALCSHNLCSSNRLLSSVKADPMGVAKMATKSLFCRVLVDNISAPCALVLKQEALSLGAEVAIPAHALRGKSPCQAIIMGTCAQLLKLANDLKSQPFSDMPRIIQGLKEQVEYGLYGPRNFSVDGLKYNGAKETLIVGILNITPDSFSDGGENFQPEKAINRGLAMMKEGVHIIDIGGESTRPNSGPVNFQEEKQRILPIISALAQEGAIISVDTQKCEIARLATQAGAKIINDIGGLRDITMAKIAAETGASLIIMHMQGEPENMQKNPHYDDLMGEISSFLYQAANRAMDLGIPREKICLDPGIGFGKTLTDNIIILNRLDEICSLGFPVMVGTSRKSFIGKILDQENPKERLEGTLASSLMAISKGAKALRVHDTKAVIKAAKMADTIHYFSSEISKLKEIDNKSPQNCEPKEIDNKSQEISPLKDIESKSPCARAYIGIGSNLGDRSENIAKALEMLDQLQGTRLLRTSPLIETEPDNADGGKYLNGVAEIDTVLGPQNLLDLILKIESQLGRKRPYPNAPRTIDLDILLYGDKTISEDDLIIPHPRMLKRDFVMRPLCGLCPEIIIPGTGKKASEYINSHHGDQTIET